MSGDIDVLVVDDSPEARFARRRALQAAGFSVREAGTAAAGFAAIDERMPDVVVLDVHLPDVHGFEVCRRIKDDPRTERLPVVQVSSSRVGVVDQVSGLEGGADAYLPEPVDPAVLTATISALLRERRIEAALREANEHLAAIQRLTARLSAALTPDDVAAVTLAAARDAMGADNSTLLLLNDGVATIFRSTDGPLPQLGTLDFRDPANATAPAVRAFETGDVVGLDTRAAVEARFGADAAQPMLAGIGSVAWAPMQRHGRRDGTLAVWQDRERAWSAGDLDTIAAMAEVGAQALGRSELFAAERAARAEAEAARERFADRADLLLQLESLRGRSGRAEHIASWCTRDLADFAIVFAADHTVEGEAGADFASPAAELLARIPSPEARALVEADWDGGCGLLVPLHARGARIGTLALARCDAHRAFGPHDRQTLTEVAGPLALVLDNAGLDDEQRHIARTLQRSLLAGAVAPLPPTVTSALRYRAGDLELHIGGDWHDVLTRRDGQVAIVVGDVVGHGLHASAAMGALRSTTRALIQLLETPEAVLTELDATANATSQTPMATVACALLDPETGRLQHASAGHPPLLIVRADGTSHFLEGGRSLPIAGLGPLRDGAVDELGPGDLLIVCTDGLIERRGQSIDDGLELLRATAVSARRAPTLAELADEILDTMLGQTPTDDDTALVVVRRAVHAGDACSLRTLGDAGALAQAAGELALWLDGQGLEADERAAMVRAVRSALHAVSGVGADEVDVEARREGDVVHVAIRCTGDGCLELVDPRLEGCRAVAGGSLLPLRFSVTAIEA